jgi:hypothetical protein
MIQQKQLGQHSASVCIHKNKVYVSYYKAQCEGWGQEVVIKYRTADGFIEPEICGDLRSGDGNPVIFEVDGELYLAVSRFKDEMCDENNVHLLWKNTNMHVFWLLHNQEGNKDVIVLVEVGSYPNCAPRCAPLVYSDGEEESCLLPCYDETAGQGLLITVNDKSIHRGGLIKCPYKIIQPTLMQDGERIIAWARVFDREQLEEEQLAYCGISYMTYDWAMVSEPSMRPPNHNESLVVFKHNDHPYLVFNEKPIRTNLVLMGERKKRLLLHQTKYASYPNFCLDGDLVHIVFTVYNARGFENNSIQMVTVDLIDFEIIDRVVEF